MVINDVHIAIRILSEIYCFFLDNAVDESKREVAISCPRRLIIKKGSTIHRL